MNVDQAVNLPGNAGTGLGGVAHVVVGLGKCNFLDL